MADKQLEIKGNEGQAILHLSGDGNDFIVRLTDEGLEAKIRGWWNAEMDEPRQLVEWFEDLAACWKGWNAEKEWRALEAPFYLWASHDGLGHVTVKARLESGWVAPTWSADASLVVEAGGLDDIAAQVARFLSDS